MQERLFSEDVIPWGREAHKLVMDKAESISPAPRVPGWSNGANHVCVQPLHPEGQPLPDYDALTVLAA